MSSPIKKVAVAGGTGNLGPAIVQQLLDAGFAVTVLTRSTSSSESLPAAVTATKVDYNDLDSLVSALRGHDAVVSNLNFEALGDPQRLLIDASIAAGVTRFIPSEFGSNTLNTQVRSLPVFGAKIATQEYLAEKSASGQLSYTLIITGAFLDWPNSAFHIRQNNVNAIYDGGETKFNATTLEGIGKAVAGVLAHPEQTRNRAVYVASATVTQNQLLALAQKKAGAGVEIKKEDKSTAEIEKSAYEVLKTGNGDIGGAMFGFIIRSLFAEGYGSAFEKTENELVGVPRLSEQELGDLVAKFL